MTEAMQNIREALGEDAIIVATREEDGGKSVCVTAAIESGCIPLDEPAEDPNFELGRGGNAAPADDWLQYDDEEDENAIYEEITEILLRHSATEDVNDQILSCATVMGLEQPHIAMIAALEHLFSYTPLPTENSKKPLMLIGMPGAGKTLAAAKIAARGVMSNLNISVITTDTARAGGAEQLEAFTKLLNIDLKKAKTPEELETAIKNSSGSDQIIIDSSGTNPFDKKSVHNIAKMISVGNIDPILAMPAGIDPNESAEIAKIFRSIGAKKILPTRIDITKRYGGILSAALHGGLSFTDASNSEKVAAGFMNISPKSLVHLLMPDNNHNIRQTIKNDAK